MTCIASFKTKKDFKAAVETLGADHVYIEDPSIFAPYSGRLCNHPEMQKQGGMITVTNHPKRSWFASVDRIGDRWVVK